MSFGGSSGDIITAATLALRAYRAYKGIVSPISDADLRLTGFPSGCWRFREGDP